MPFRAGDDCGRRESDQTQRILAPGEELRNARLIDVGQESGGGDLPERARAERGQGPRGGRGPVLQVRASTSQAYLEAQEGGDLIPHRRAELRHGDGRVKKGTRLHHEDLARSDARLSSSEQARAQLTERDGRLNVGRVEPEVLVHHRSNGRIHGGLDAGLFRRVRDVRQRGELKTVVPVGLKRRHEHLEGALARIPLRGRRLLRVAVDHTRCGATRDIRQDLVAILGLLESEGPPFDRSDRVGHRVGQVEVDVEGERVQDLAGLDVDVEALARLHTLEPLGAHRQAREKQDCGDEEDGAYTDRRQRNGMRLQGVSFFRRIR